MKSSGSRPRQVTSLLPGDLSHVDPDWGPDGNWLAFVSHREKGGVRYSRIERVRVDGSQRTVVSSGGKSLKPGGHQPLGDLDPNYSPDGAMIWSTRRLEGGPVRLFAFGANAYYGGKSERNMSWPVHPDAIERSPSFSPDGRRIILTRSSPKFGHPTRQLVLTDPHSSFRRYLTSREDWDAWHPSWFPFAQSRAEKEMTSTVVHYMARIPTGSNPVPLRKSKEKGNLGNGSVRRLETAKNIHFVVSRLQPSGPKSNKKSSYRVKWKLGIPPKKVISLTLKFEGQLNGFSSEGRSLRFQLMDWRKKKWVTIFRHEDVSNDNIKITHEFTPINFISRNSHQVLLRIDSPGKRASSNLTLESDHLSLDVRRN